MPLLAQPGLNWSVVVDKLPGAFDYYILTMKEGGEEGSRDALSRYREAAGFCSIFEFYPTGGVSGRGRVWTGVKRL